MEMGQKMLRGGFIQIPLVLMIVFGIGMITAGDYYVRKHVGDKQPVEQIEKQFEHATTTATDGTSTTQLETDTSNELCAGEADTQCSGEKRQNELTQLAEPVSTSHIPFANTNKDFVDEDEASKALDVPTVTATNPDIRAQLIAVLENDIQDFTQLLQAVRADRASWIKLSKDAAIQRAEAFKSFTLVPEFTELRNFGTRNMRHYEEDAQNAEKTYIKFYLPLETEIQNQSQKTASMRDTIKSTIFTTELQNKVAALLDENSEQKVRFVKFAQFINMGNASLEQGRSDIYLEVLDGADTILASYGVVNETRSELADIEYQASLAIPSKPFTCWADTTSQDGLFSGKYTTRIECN